MKLYGIQYVMHTYIYTCIHAYISHICLHTVVPRIGSHRSDRTGPGADRIAADRTRKKRFAEKHEADRLEANRIEPDGEADRRDARLRSRRHPVASAADSYFVGKGRISKAKTFRKTLFRVAAFRPSVLQVSPSTSVLSECMSS